MAVSEISKKWIEAGYELFALTGPKEFKVEKLANQLGMNKSGFYHYFLDREIFFEELLNYHDQLGVKFANELAHLQNFMPDFPNLYIKYHTGLQFQIQLRKNTNIPIFREYFFKVKNRNNQYQLPLWAKYIQLSDMNLAAELFEIAVDLMVVRLENDKITFDYLEGIFKGIKQTIQNLQHR